MMNHFTPEESSSLNDQDDEATIYENSPSASKVLLLSIGTMRRMLAHPPYSIQERGSASVNLEPAVENLRHYCIQQRQLAPQRCQRNAYDFLIRHITDMRPDTHELRATLTAWANYRQTQAQRLRQTGFALALAEDLEVAAQICEALVAQLSRIEQ